MPEVHARLSASGSAKWLNCPGSIKLESEFPNVTSAYAEEGTKAHALGELKINLELGNISRCKYIDEINKLGNISDEMEFYIEGYKDFVIEKFNARKSNSKSVTIAVEQKLDFSNYVPEGFGTGDVVIAYDGGVEIIDLKYGQGVKVSAVLNPQLRLYGLGAINEYDWIYGIDEITYTIYQPRVDSISTYSECADTLTYWGSSTVCGAAQKALEDRVVCVAGEYCDSHFCKARAICRTYNEKKQELAKYDFIKPAKLTNEEIADILEVAPKIKSWCEVVEAYALEKSLQGEKFPGYKLVASTSRRKYSDENAVISVLSENGYDVDKYINKKVKSISDLTKLLDSDVFNTLIAPLIITPEGKPKLVPEIDKRPELGSTAGAIKDFGVGTNE